MDGLTSSFGPASIAIKPFAKVVKILSFSVTPLVGVVKRIFPLEKKEVYQKEKITKTNSNDIFHSNDEKDVVEILNILPVAEIKNEVEAAVVNLQIANQVVVEAQKPVNVEIEKLKKEVNDADFKTSKGTFKSKTSVEFSKVKKLDSVKNNKEQITNVANILNSLTKNTDNDLKKQGLLEAIDDLWK